MHAAVSVLRHPPADHSEQPTQNTNYTHTESLNEEPLTKKIILYRIIVRMAARQLASVECSLQPLDFAFHPSKQILAAGIVDGTVECM
jgi:hypothetical protein